MTVPAGGPPPPDQLIAWRFDRGRYAASWDSGEGGFQFGGRWNSPGTRVVYCSLDPATAILEVAVHKGFRQIATMPHVLTSAFIADGADVHYLRQDDLPEPNWLQPGEPSAGQRAFGDRLLKQHKLIAIPSVVSHNSWNLLISLPAAVGAYHLRLQEPFILDPRLHPAKG